MSGIAGIIRFDGAPVEPGLLQAMTSAMAHRGPDGIGHWQRGSVALGHCMMRTTPESQRERQPLTNEDQSVVLVMDGRLDNWRELRRDLLLRGAVLRDRSDAELVLRAYEIYGNPGCLERIEGDFALVIWDARRRQALCARDRMGHKPFLFWRSEKLIALGSEMSAIMGLPWIDARINEGVVAELLTQEFFPTSETLWSGVHRLPPARYMRVVGDGTFSQQCYWSPESVEDLSYADDRAYLEHYRQLLFDQLRRSSRSAGTIAAEVSGGLDSSAVYAGCVHLHREGLLPAPGVRGFAFDMSEDAPDFDDTAYASAVEQFVGAEITRVKPFVDTPEGYRARAARTMDLPGYPNGVMHLSIYDQVHVSGSNALLTGNGGDEWLGGTRSYFSEELFAGRVAMALGLLRRDARSRGLLESLRTALRDVVRNALPPRVRAALRPALARLRPSRDGSPLELSRTLSSLHAARRRSTANHARAGFQRQDRQRMLQRYRHPFRVFAIEQTELFGAGRGIEIRHPLDSAAMLGFAMACPVRLRRRDGVDRFLHREAMAGLLPRAVLERSSKASFDVLFLRSLANLHSEHVAPDIVRSWLEIAPDDLVQLCSSAAAKDALSWAEWSAWGFYACSTLAHLDRTTRSLG